MTVEEERKAYDRRARAWTFLVLGALATFFVGIGGLSHEAMGWRVLGYVGVCGGLVAVVYGLILFQKPRP